MAERPEFDSDSMDDLGLPDAAATPEMPVEAPVEPVEAPQAEQVTPDPDMFSRDYVEELRRENAKWRTQAQEYNRAFDGYDDETRQQLLTYFQLAKRAEAGDQAAAQELQAWFGDDDTDDTADDDDFVPMSRQEYEQFVREAAREEASRLLSERESHQQQIQAVDNVRSTAEQMGYDPSSPDYILLLKFANEADPDEHPDLLAYADQQVRAYHQSIVERTQGDYLAKKEQDTMTAPRVASPGSSPNLAAGPPTSFAEARARMDERLQNR